MQVLALPRTSIGKKVIMALSGIIWVGFIAIHMYGNTHAFQGRDEFNHYAHFLRTMGEPIFGYGQLLFLARVVFIVSIALHIWAAFTLYQQARHARPANYAVKRVVQANYAVRFIRLGGVVLAFFLLYHLAHFTWGVPLVHPTFVREDPYGNLIAGFQFLPNVLLYLVALVALGAHLFHGVWSMFQTLGVNSREYDGTIRAFAIALAVIIPAGFSLVPISVMLGILK